MINHKYKNNICTRCGCKRTRKKITLSKGVYKDVVLFDNSIIKTPCIIEI